MARNRRSSQSGGSGSNTAKRRRPSNAEALQNAGEGTKGTRAVVDTELRMPSRVPTQLPIQEIAGLHNFEKVYGKHSVRAVFIKRPQDVRRMIIAGREEYHTEFLEFAKKFDVEVNFLDWKSFRDIGDFTEDDRHQGIIIFTKPKLVYGDMDIERLEDARCVILLDQVSNPQNLATIIRCGGFFGVDAILIMKNRSASLTPTVIRYAVGGTEFIDIFEITNVSQTLTHLKSMGFWTYGLDERGESTLGRTDFATKAAIVIGAEGEGLRPKTRKYCDFLVRIPGGRKGLESINAAVAASIAMAEIYRMDD